MYEPKEKVMKKKYERKAKVPVVNWTAMVTIEELSMRKNRWNKPYCLLYNATGLPFLCSERDAQKLALFEPYQIRGTVTVVPGGQFFRVDQIELFDPSSFNSAFSSRV